MLLIFLVQLRKSCITVKPMLIVKHNHKSNYRNRIHLTLKYIFDVLFWQDIFTTYLLIDHKQIVINIMSSIFEYYDFDRSFRSFGLIRFIFQC